MNTTKLRPKAEPAPDNQPNEKSKCPRCKERTEGFRWSPREYTYRCDRCRVPLKFIQGVPELYFDRNVADPVAGGWRLPDSTAELKRCILALGTKLINEPRVATEVKKELVAEGHKRKTIDRAVVSLRLKERQRERPGPVYFILSDKIRVKVLEGAIEEMLDWLSSETRK